MPFGSHGKEGVDGSSPSEGFRTYDGDIEGEAYGVGGAMLMPYGLLFPLCRRAVPVTQIAARFELSVAFTNYRINRAGLRKMYEKRIGALELLRNPVR